MNLGASWSRTDLVACPRVSRQGAMGPSPTSPFDPRLEQPLRLASVKKEKAMYSDGFGVAVIVSIVALLSPVLWIGWWFLADLGERANGTYPTRHSEGAEPELRRAA